MDRRGSQTAHEFFGDGTSAPDERLTAAYGFTLPVELIAQRPMPDRDASRLMVVEGDAVRHRHFRDLPELLRAGDVLVLNETRVIAARILGRRYPSGGRIELLLLHPAASKRYDPQATRWLALVRPARRQRAGQRIAFDAGLGYATVTRALGDGMCEIDLTLALGFEDFLIRAGRLALPPYIHEDSAEAQTRYQTVFARVPGSVAAPTASLHFTSDLLDVIRGHGVEIVRLTLNVGVGTFRPMSAPRIDDHAMHAEAYAIPAETAAAIERAASEGRRVIAAGTTVVRALEGNIRAHGRIVEGEDATDLFITPGFAFRVVDAMITNFHLPQSTLLVMVSAFAGRRRVLHAYAEAIARGYRFFSFGDAMWIQRTP